MISRISRLSTTIAMSGLIATTAYGQAVVYESFDYEAGTVSGNNGGTGFSGAWTNTKNNPNQDAFPGLTYGSLVTSGGNARGAAWSGLARPIGSTLADASLLDDGATLWVSAIMDLSGANLTNADLNLSLTNSSKFVSDVFGNRLDLLGDSSEGIGFGHTGGNIRGAWWQDSGNADGDAERNLTGASGLQLSSDGVSNPTGALVVAKIEWGIGSGDETITLYAPDVNLTQGAPVLAATSIPALDQSTFDLLAIQFKDSTPRIDEIRFGAAYEDVAVLPDPMTIRVNTATGEVLLKGATEQTFDISYYEITSAADSLNASGWNSLADQDYDGNGPANGSGDGWEEAGGSDSGVLAEAFLLGSSPFTPATEVSLGSAYNTAIDAQDLVFSFLTNEGQQFDGLVEYFASLPGDTDFDGDIDDADLGTAFSNFTGPVGAAGGKTAADGDTDGDGDVDDADLANAFSGFTGPLGPANVPEPASFLLLAAGAAAGLTRRRRHRDC